MKHSPSNNKAWSTWTQLKIQLRGAVLEAEAGADFSLLLQESQSTVVHNPPDGVKVMFCSLCQFDPVGWHPVCVDSAFLFLRLLFRDQRRATPPMTRRKWKVGKVLTYFLPYVPSLSALSFCVYLPVVTRQLCWDTTHGCHTLDRVPVACGCALVFIVSLAAFCVCVLADSSALSQSSAAEEMPPLLPSPQSSPASKFIHGNQKLYSPPLPRGKDLTPPPIPHSHPGFLKTLAMISLHYYKTSLPSLCLVFRVPTGFGFREYWAFISCFCTWQKDIQEKVEHCRKKAKWFIIWSTMDHIYINSKDLGTGEFFQTEEQNKKLFSFFCCL